MSMPSSRLEVATTQRSEPSLSDCSMSRRCSLETEPWCDRAISSGLATTRDTVLPVNEPYCSGTGATGGWPAARALRSAWSSLRRAVSFSATPRELANTMVERRASTWSRMLASTCGQIEPTRPVGSRSAPGPACGGRSAMSSTGTTMRTSRWRGLAGSTTVTGRSPPRKAATCSTGRTVADRPMRCAGTCSNASSRSRLSARWVPRLLPATAWISSTITVSTSRRVSRAFEVSIRNSDSGVVIRMSGGRRSRRARSATGVSPVRMPTVRTTAGSPRRSRSASTPCSGTCRLRCTSAPNALIGDR